MDIVFSDRRGPKDTGTHFYKFSQTEQKLIAESIEAIGEQFNVDTMFADGKTRKLANIYYMSKFYNDFKAPKQIIQQNLF